MGYEAYLKANPAETVVDAGRIADVLTPSKLNGARQCTECRAIVAPKALADNRCPSCGSASLVASDVLQVAGAR